MALQPSLRPLILVGPPDAPHTLDIFLDYVCPFSAKMAKAIDTMLIPLLKEGGEYAGKVKLIIRLQVQPWHSTSTLTHEAALAAMRASPENFWPFSLELFKHQQEYFDIPASSLSPLQVRQKLAELASTVIPADAVDRFKALLTLQGTPNGGVQVTDDLKYMVKFSRQNGVHGSPTVLLDGLIAPEIESSWTEKEWRSFLATKAATQ